MEINKIQISEDQITIDKVFKRFIQYMDNNLEDQDPIQEKIITVEEFKKRREQDAVNNYLHFIDVVTCDAVFDTISAKVRILSLVDMYENEITQVEFEDVYKIFKEVLEKLEKMYKDNGMNLYDLYRLRVIDLVTTECATEIVKRYINPNISSVFDE